MKIKKILQTAALGGALFSATANAQLEIPNDQYWDSGDPNRWRTIVAFPMMWAPSIGLDIETGDGATTEATITFKDILERLQFGLMGELYVTRAWFGFFLKGMYMDVGDELENSTTIPVNPGPGPGLTPGIDTNVDLTLSMGLYDVGFSWRVWRNLRIITLGRATSVKVDGSFTLAVTPDPDRPDSGEPTNSDVSFDVDPGLSWDYNLGLEYGWWLGSTKRHGINIYGDAAVGGDSDSAWLAELRYMYRVSKLNNFWLGWRQYEMVTNEDDEGDQTTVSLSGPLVGWAFSF